MKIATLSPLTYSPGKLEYFSFIRSGAGAEFHQNPSFYVFPNGHVMMYWFGYDYNECSNNAVLLYSISKDRGINWSDPQIYMADYPGGVPYVRLLRIGKTQNALMFQVQSIMDELEIDENRHIATAGGDYFKSRTRVCLRRSTDGGRSFDHGVEIPYSTISYGKELPHVGFYGSIEELMQLKSGRIIAAFMFMDPDRSNIAKNYQHFTGACLISDDHGKTWRTSQAPITSDIERGVMEMQIAETQPNHLYCLFRTKSGYLHECSSHDGGETWSPSTPSRLPSPESMPRMIKLNSGNLLLAWNNASSTGQQPRHPMAVAVSQNSGQTWSPPRIIADETGSHQLSNHGLVQLDDGRILLCLSHYFALRPDVSNLDMAIFDEEWLCSPR